VCVHNEINRELGGDVQALSCDQPLFYTSAAYLRFNLHKAGSVEWIE
jgi:hypothetical protein